MVGLYSDVVLKAYLRRKFYHASDNFIYCNSFHCDKVNCRGGPNTLQEEVQVHPSTERIYHHKKRKFFPLYLTLKRMENLLTEHVMFRGIHLFNELCGVYLNRYCQGRIQRLLQGPVVSLC